MSNCSKLWSNIFSISDHTEGSYKLVTDSDGNVSNESGAYDEIKFLFDAYEEFETKLTSEEWRQAHNLDHLCLDARNVLKYNHDEDVPMLAPQLVGLVILFRYYAWHPLREDKANYDQSKQAAVAILTKLLAQITTFRSTHPTTIVKFPELAMEWFNEEFLTQFGFCFDYFVDNAIPSQLLAQDFDTHPQLNTATWLLDIHNAINGQDSTNFTSWEVGLRSEQAGMGLDEYKIKRQAEWTKIKPYVFRIGAFKKEYGSYVKDNINDYDFDMNEPYEEDLEELWTKLPAL